jgi:hypothetical protein
MFILNTVRLSDLRLVCDESDTYMHPQVLYSAVPMEVLRFQQQGDCRARVVIETADKVQAVFERYRAADAPRGAYKTLWRVQELAPETSTLIEPKLPPPTNRGKS